MILTAFIAMITADAIDRHLREQQHRGWVAAAEEARCATTVAPRRPGFVLPGFDPRRPERPL
jgi:hypothetical protein